MSIHDGKIGGVAPRGAGWMTEDEACSMLGIPLGSTRAEIVAAIEAETRAGKMRRDRLLMSLMVPAQDGEEEAARVTEVLVQVTALLGSIPRACLLGSANGVIQRLVHLTRERRESIAVLKRVCVALGNDVGWDEEMSLLRACERVESAIELVHERPF